MDIKCRVCLASSEAKMYHSLGDVFPAYLNTHCSVLDILQTVTSSRVILSSGWPSEICTACLKCLRECNIFIQEFHKAQTFLKNSVIENRMNVLFNKNEEEIILKVEPPDEDYLDPLYINAENSDPISYFKPETKPLIKPILHTQNVPLKVLDKSTIKKKGPKKPNTVKKRNRKTNKLVMSLVKTKTNKKDHTISDHNYTKDPDCQGNDFEEYSEESISNDETNSLKNQSTTIKRESNKKSPQSPMKFEKIVVMSVKDVLNAQRKTRSQQSLAKKPEVKSRILNPKITPSAITQPKSDGLKVLVTRKIQNQTRNLVKRGQVFHCNTCSKAYSTSKGLLLHKYVHTPEYMEELKCKQCGHQCQTRSALFHHRQKHNGRTHKCDECDRIMFTKSQVLEHKRRMHGDGMPEKFMCTECGKRFKYSSALKYHMISTHHKEEKEYLCGFCGYKSVTKAYLKRHERCHTDERPYMCKLCPKSFRGSAELQSHILMHEKKMRHHCKFCEKGFISSWNMKIHWLKHEGDYACKLCSKTFPDDVVLKFHYFYRHKIKDVSPEENENASFKDDESLDGELMEACVNLIDSDPFLK